jgi:hypothetical protein
MPELGPYGSVRGARGNSRPYRDNAGCPGLPVRHMGLDAIQASKLEPLASIRIWLRANECPCL